MPATLAPTRSSSSAAALAPPRPLSPLGGAIEDGHAVAFSWWPVADATGYTVQIAADRLFRQGLVTVEAGPSTSLTLTESVPVGRELFWRVRAATPAGATPWSAYGRFTAGSDAAVDRYRAGLDASRRQTAQERARAEAERRAALDLVPPHERDDLLPSDGFVKGLAFGFAFLLALTLAVLIIVG